jgi:hypothetical protein
MIHEAMATVVALCERQKGANEEEKERKDALRKRLNEAMRRKSTQAE